MLPQTDFSMELFFSLTPICFFSNYFVGSYFPSIRLSIFSVCLFLSLYNSIFFLTFCLLLQNPFNFFPFFLFIILSLFILSPLILSALIASYLISSYLICSHRILFYLILCALIASYFILSPLILSALIASYLISSYLICSHLIGVKSDSPFILKFAAGSLAGALGSIVGNPFDVLKTRMMTAEGDLSRRVRGFN